MDWSSYVAGFFAGVFLVNAVPHFVRGSAGNKFPTPFATPRGLGLSSPVTNMAWALANLVVGYWLLRGGHCAAGQPASLAAPLVGGATTGFYLSNHFQHKHRE